MDDQMGRYQRTARLKRVRSHQSRKKIFRLAMAITVIAVSIFSLRLLQPSTSTPTQTIAANKPYASPTDLPAPTQIGPTLSPASSEGLQKAVANALIGTKGNYGIVIKNLKTGEAYYTNPQKQYKSGSLYKLWVMATAFQQIQEGKLNENEMLKEDVKVLNQKFKIDPEFAEKKEGTINLSIHDALEQMITISDNYAALILAQKVKLANIANFLKSNNFSLSHLSTDDQAPLTSPVDIANFFEKLYQNKLADTVHTQKMIDLLKRQRLNSKIPKYLPSEIQIAHKTGELFEASHDAGIVYSPNGDYIIVILSESDEASRPLANERLAQVSKEVYNYFNSSNKDEGTP
jgi:beta-lactamase class A